MRFAAALLALSLLTAPAIAEDRPTAAIQSVIGTQIDAFRADDSAAAYDLAAPQIRQAFPNPDVFMAMVKSGYQPVYRPKSVTFGRLESVDGAFAQEVFLVGADGEAYTALYTMQQQPDGSWKIAGCRIIKTPGNAV